MMHALVRMLVTKVFMESHEGLFTILDVSAIYHVTAGAEVAVVAAVVVVVVVEEEGGGRGEGGPAWGNVVLQWWSSQSWFC